MFEVSAVHSERAFLRAEPNEFSGEFRRTTGRYEIPIPPEDSSGACLRLEGFECDTNTTTAINDR